MHNVYESSQLITSAHCQAINAHHLQRHKWAEDQPSVADQIKSTADENPHFWSQTDLFVKSRTFISRINSDAHDEEDNEWNHKTITPL